MNQNTRWYCSAITSFIVTLILVNPILSDAVDRKLIDGSVMELGRYHFTFEAYDYISEDEAPSVVSWGSSKMRESFDGIEMEKHSAHSDANFYNLGYASEHPYLRLPELSSLISAKPEVLVLELGPNTFSFLPTPLDQNSLEKINSVIYHSPIIGNKEYLELMEAEDLDLIEDEIGERMKGYSRYSFPAVENSLIDRFEEENTGWDCDEKLTNVRCAPHADSDLYDDYLRKPPQFSNYLERIKPLNDNTLETFYGEKLDNYIKSKYHNPEGVYNKNHRAFDYIIDQAIEHQIDVVLVALPYNPVLMQRLSINQWDYVDEAIDNYSAREELTVVDLLNDPRFGNDSFFNDFSHMSKLGEDQLTRVLLPKIDQVLTAKLGRPEVVKEYDEPIEMPPTNSFYLRELISIDIQNPSLNLNGSNSLVEHSWSQWTQGGKTGLAVLPNNGMSTRNLNQAPYLQYCFEIPTSGYYYFWIESNSPDANSDSIWLGIDGELMETGLRGVGLFNLNETISWYNKGDDGNEIGYSFTRGSHCLDVWMREDGVVLVNLMLTTDITFTAGD